MAIVGVVRINHPQLYKNLVAGGDEPTPTMEQASLFDPNLRPLQQRLASTVVGRDSRPHSEQSFVRLPVDLWMFRVLIPHISGKARVIRSRSNMA